MAMAMASCGLSLRTASVVGVCCSLRASAPVTASVISSSASFSGGELPSVRGSQPGLGRMMRRAGRVVRACADLKKLGEVEPLELSAESSKGLPAAPGVYALYDKEGNLQFVGITRRISSSIQTHMQELPDLCGSVKVAVVNAPQKSALAEAWQLWLQEYVDLEGKVPPGNESGNKTWTERKPRAAKPEIKLTPGPHVTLTIPLTDLIDKIVKECRVVAFIKGTRTAPQCGFSHRVLTILNESGADYEVVNVLDEHHNPGLREAIKVYSEWPTIPQVYVKGDFLGGADILDEMVQNGEIKSFLQKS